MCWRLRQGNNFPKSHCGVCKSSLLLFVLPESSQWDDISLRVVKAFVDGVVCNSTRSICSKFCHIFLQGFLNWYEMIVCPKSHYICELDSRCYINFYTTKKSHTSSIPPRPYKWIQREYFPSRAIMMIVCWDSVAIIFVSFRTTKRSSISLCYPKSCCEADELGWSPYHENCNLMLPIQRRFFLKLWGWHVVLESYTSWVPFMFLQDVLVVWSSSKILFLFTWGLAHAYVRVFGRTAGMWISFEVLDFSGSFRCKFLREVIPKASMTRFWMVMVCSLV